MNMTDQFREEAVQKALILCDNFFKAATGEEPPEAKQHPLFKILNDLNHEHPENPFIVSIGNRTEFLRQHTAQFKKAIAEYGQRALDFCKLKEGVHTDEAAKTLVLYFFGILLERAEKENSKGVKDFHDEFQKFLNAKTS